MAIKKLQNNFTTPEQSKRLLELGVPADSADCYYVTKNNYTAILHDELFTKCRDNLIKVSKTAYRVKMQNDDVLPCWSVGRLIEIVNIYSIPKIKEAGFHLLAQDFDDLIETMIVSIKMKVEHNWIDFSK